MPPKKYTPYISFCIQQRPLVKAEMPYLNPRQITSELGRRWRELKTTPIDEDKDSPSLLLCLFFYLYYVVAFSIIWHLFHTEERVFSTYRLPNPYDNVYPWQLPSPAYQLERLERYPYVHPHTYVTLLGILIALFGG